MNITTDKEKHMIDTDKKSEDLAWKNEAVNEHILCTAGTFPEYERMSYL